MTSSKSIGESEVAEESELFEPAEEEAAGSNTLDWRRIVVISVATLTVLAVGAAVGMLITLAKLNTSAPPGPDSVDVGFAHDMSVHHYQAVSMASWTRDHSTDIAVRQLAMDIESTQTGQIGRMTGWLQLWGQPELPDGPERMMWMAMPNGGHAGHGGQATGAGTTTMPGMATPGELSKLRSLSGKELDVYFLQLMLRHHQGGLGMAQYAAERASQPAVRNLAERIVSGQRSEIKVMTDLLTERGAQPLPAP